IILISKILIPFHKKKRMNQKDLKNILPSFTKLLKIRYVMRKKPIVYVGLSKMVEKKISFSLRSHITADQCYAALCNLRTTKTFLVYSELTFFFLLVI